MKYKKELIDRIIEMKQSGEFTDKDIQRIVNISPETWHDWKNKKPEFSESLKRAEDDFIKNNLKQSARKGLKILVEGREYEETTIEYKVSKSQSGKVSKSKVFEKVISKKIMPNPTAVIFALKNVDTENFRDKHEVKSDGKISFLDLISEINEDSEFNDVIN